MKKLFLLLLSFSLFNICPAQTQFQMNTDADEHAKKADKQLNIIYNKVLARYSSDKVFIKNLRDAQRVWIKPRDAQLKMKFPKKEAGYYGSVYPTCYALYLEKLTRERISTLREWLNGLEGDVCNRSVVSKKN